LAASLQEVQLQSAIDITLRVAAQILGEREGCRDVIAASGGSGSPCGCSDRSSAIAFSAVGSTWNIELPITTADCSQRTQPVWSA
jgi:hypothetical protein